MDALLQLPARRGEQVVHVLGGHGNLGVCGRDRGGLAVGVADGLHVQQAQVVHQIREAPGPLDPFVFRAERLQEQSRCSFGGVGDQLISL